MKLHFSKYSGAGNDFMIIDDRNNEVELDTRTITKLCHRYHGVGADGIIMLENSDCCDFKMRIFNSDGSEAEMCGNGIRCLALDIKRRGYSNACCSIESLHRKHHVSWKGNNANVEMGPPTNIEWNIPIPLPKGCVEAAYLDTGVPHTVIFYEDDTHINFLKFAPEVRRHPYFGSRGTNVNLVKVDGNNVTVRTYERGVEAETEACGTGATAAAVAAAYKYKLTSPISVYFPSGSHLKIYFDRCGDTFSSTSMEGPCSHIFDGTIDLQQYQRVGA